MREFGRTSEALSLVTSPHTRNHEVCPSHPLLALFHFALPLSEMLASTPNLHAFARVSTKTSCATTRLSSKPQPFSWAEPRADVTQDGVGQAASGVGLESGALKALVL